MADLTNKNLNFLSNEKLINILRSILNEIDVVASSGAHRSTTYLAVSAIEGIFGEILKLKRLNPNTVPLGVWPEYKDSKRKGKPKKFADLTLEDKDQILGGVDALHPDFKALYATSRKFRNYMHPQVELRNQTPIAQAVAQLALACLNALIETYESLRFVSGSEWRAEHGIAEVPLENTIHMPQNPGDQVSLLISKDAAEHFRAMTFTVIVPRSAIFNFVYSYFSQNQFLAARIEGREGSNGEGYDNGRLHCIKWRAWAIDKRYVNEPNPKQQKHTVKVVLDPPTAFAVAVDGVQLVLAEGAPWDFDPKGKIGFMSEWGMVSIIDLQVQPV
jgi:hypothetical protein